MNLLRCIGSATLLLLPGLLAVSLGDRPAAAPASATSAQEEERSHGTAARRPATPAPQVFPTPREALGAPPPDQAVEAALRDSDLVIDHSSNWQGYLEPCG